MRAAQGAHGQRTRVATQPRRSARPQSAQEGRASDRLPANCHVSTAFLIRRSAITRRQYALFATARADASARFNAARSDPLTRQRDAHLRGARRIVGQPRVDADSAPQRSWMLRRPCDVVAAALGSRDLQRKGGPELSSLRFVQQAICAQACSALQRQQRMLQRRAKRACSLRRQPSPTAHAGCAAVRLRFPYVTAARAALQRRTPLGALMAPRRGARGPALPPRA
jgi:hypothetical protein